MLDIQPETPAAERVEDHESPFLPPRTHTEDELHLWYHDGSIILVAGTYMFKVFRGCLANYSEVFEGMFTLPQASCGNVVEQDTVDGCPVVRMYDDPYELAQFLRVLHDRREYDANKPCEAAKVAAILRLCTKYGIHKIRQEALEHFVRYFPCTYTEYEEGDRDSLLWQTERSRTLDLVALAREANAPVLLPMILYEAAIMPAENFDDKTSLSFVLNSFNGVVSPHDKLLCMIARERMRREFQVQVIRCSETWTHDEQLDVDHNTCCFTELNMKQFVGDDAYQSMLLDCDILCWDTWYSMAQEAQMILCSACDRRYHEAACNARKNLWSHLPKFFELSSWQKLADESGLKVDLSCDS